MTTLYGIPNCGTVKKARAWLAEHGIAHHFHDYRKAGVDPLRLGGWAERAGWQRLLNTAGTTFRKLPDAEKADLDEERAVALMVAHPSAIRRPVIEHDGALLVGFDADRYADVLTGGQK